MARSSNTTAERSCATPTPGCERAASLATGVRHRARPVWGPRKGWIGGVSVGDRLDDHTRLRLLHELVRPSLHGSSSTSSCRSSSRAAATRSTAPGDAALLGETQSIRPGRRTGSRRPCAPRHRRPRAGPEKPRRRRRTPRPGRSRPRRPDSGGREACRSRCRTGQPVGSLSRSWCSPLPHSAEPEQQRADSREGGNVRGQSGLSNSAGTWVSAKGSPAPVCPSAQNCAPQGEDGLSNRATM